MRNLGSAILPAGVEVGFYHRENTIDVLLGTGTTQSTLFPGQIEEVSYTADASDNVDVTDTFVAKIHTDPANPTFHECREDNNESNEARAICVD